MTLSTPKVTVTVQVEHEDAVWLTEQAVREGLSRSGLIRQAVRWYRSECEAIPYMATGSEHD